MERVRGIEPLSPAWKAGIIAIIRYPHSTTRSARVLCKHRYFASTDTLQNKLLGLPGTGSPDFMEGQLVPGGRGGNRTSDLSFIRAAL